MITELERVDQPSLPGGRDQGRRRLAYRRAEVIVSWSIENMGYNLPTLVSTLQGNLYELSQFSGLKLMDLEFPASFAQVFTGRKFGIEGTRRLTGVAGPADHRHDHQAERRPVARADRGAGADARRGGDRLHQGRRADGQPAPLAVRRDGVEAVMRVINDHADRTGKKVMYAFNITDEIDAMLRHYDAVVDAGGTGVMVSLNSVGLRRREEALRPAASSPIHGHRNGWGMLNRHPLAGHRVPRLPEALAARGRRPAPRQRHRQQVLGGRRLGRALDRSVPEADARRIRGHARRLVRPDRPAGARNVSPRRRRSTCSTWPAAGSWPIRAARPPGVRGAATGLGGGRRGRAARRVRRDHIRAAAADGEVRRPMIVERLCCSAFYGDDFTGSTDAMESLARGGLRTVLFTTPPDPRRSSATTPALRAFGVAGTTPVDAAGRDGARRSGRSSRRSSGSARAIVHYKVCSTFDSSPTVGSIGRAIDIGRGVFASPFVPLVVGAPALGRYCVFGNLFARAAGDREPFRLDRHPSMSRHPVTPMDEADLRLHLAKQTKQTIGLLSVLQLEQAVPERELDRLARCGFEDHVD